MMQMPPQYFSETGEDRYLREMVFPDPTCKGVVVEIGGGDPVFFSMSRHWILSGWRGVIIEPNPRLADLHRDIGNEVYQTACSSEDRGDTGFTIVHSSGPANELSFSALEVKDGAYIEGRNHEQTKITVQCSRLSTVLDQAGVTRVDILAVDTEGWELEVLQGLDREKHAPTIIVLENYGNQSEYPEYMKKSGYEMIQKLSHNEIYRVKEGGNG